MFSQEGAIIKNNQSLIISHTVVFDDEFPEALGKALDFSYENRVWKNLFVKGSIGITNSQKLRGGNQAQYAVEAWNGGRNDYAEYFIGRPSSDFFTRTESFVVNRRLFQLSLNYRFGKRNQFIPEFGLVAGSGYRASIGAGSAAFIADTIVGESIYTNFVQTKLARFYVCHRT